MHLSRNDLTEISAQKRRLCSEEAKYVVVDESLPNRRLRRPIRKVNVTRLEPHKTPLLIMQVDTVQDNTIANCSASFFLPHI